MSDVSEEPTSMFVGDRGVKDRFDQFKRELEAEKGENLRNSDVLKELLDAYDDGE